ncbi:phosphoglycerate dehydrogenase [uncultured Sphaerochaeta sp.]|uniref:phosphoglycerate dehydrogenase n=1 Tax=uncultured Sphaerochaeta sp. TaxID=886478 RepID=UPI002A0A4CE3|nr:phosphoglycerate dehydrogenase [uncultured Sphaerochaeta sp.]
MGKVLVTASHYKELCSESIKLLEAEGHEVILNSSDMPYYSFEELKKVVPDIDAAIIGMDKWNEAVFDLAKNLKVLARFGVGVDNIDLEKAKEHGIKVVNAVGKNANAVAELAIGQIFSLLRNLPRLNQGLVEGQWLRFVGHEIKGKTIGLLGFGDIARRVAKKLSGFDTRILAYDKFPNEKLATELDVELVSQKYLLENSDLVSIHVPSNKETYHMLDRTIFDSMKVGSYLINTARGAIIDIEALCDAVESGHLAGAAIDVYETEPLPMDARVLRTDNIICTPHTGAETFETYQDISIFCAETVIAVLQGKEPRNWLNK